jgi:hypothetical protein
MSVLDGYPRRGFETCRFVVAIAAARHVRHVRFATFPPGNHDDVLRAARPWSMRVAIPAPKNKGGIVKVGFFVRAPQTCGSVTICSQCEKRRHGELLANN